MQPLLRCKTGTDNIILVNTKNLSIAREGTSGTESQRIGEIFKSYSKRLFGFIRPRVDTEEDAEDIMQEVFYELSEASSLMKPVEQLTSWLFTVARNRITDLYRKKKPSSFSSFLPEDGGDSVLLEIDELLSGTEDTPEDSYLRSLVWKELRKALDELPAEQREAFELHELKGKSFKEISEESGVSINTLISRKRYAVIYLRERLRILYNELLNF
jgi:RNA polymerase sigma factor (sigma-70 family)